MFKVIGSILALIILAVAGYFVDPNFQKQINVLIGKKAQVAEVAEQKVLPRVTTTNSSSALQNIIDSGVLKVSVQNPSKPFYEAVGGRSKGFNVDFLELMLSNSPLNSVTRKYVPVDTYVDVPKQLLNKGTADIAIDGLTFNDEDLNGVVYTIPYVKDFGYSLITMKGNNIQSASDLSGGKLGVLKGDPDALAFAQQAFPGALIVEVSDKADSSGKWIVNRIRTGEVDAVMYDYPFAVAEVEDTGLQFSIAKIKGSEIQYRIGLRKEDKELLGVLNTAIRKVVDTPEYIDLVKKYFMSDKTSTVRRAASGETSYIVNKGDTLSTIAQTVLGDKMRYIEIQSRNNLANPNFIGVGQKLIIPTKV